MSYDCRKKAAHPIVSGWAAALCIPGFAIVLSRCPLICQADGLLQLLHLIVHIQFGGHLYILVAHDLLDAINVNPTTA